MKDVADRSDIELLVVAFYKAAFADPLIGTIFTDVAHLDLDRHLPIMCDFWETVLFNAGRYRRNALRVHVALHVKHPLGAEDFDRWLLLWSQTLDARFEGPVTERAKLQASRIAGSLQRRIHGKSGSAFETVSPHDSRNSGIDHAALP